MKYKSKQTGFNGISNYLCKTLKRNIGVDDIIYYITEFRKHRTPNKPISKHHFKNIDYCQKYFKEFRTFVKQNKNG